jgi:hypothetical protein
VNPQTALIATCFTTLLSTAAAEPKTGSPAEHLPPHITQLTAFGERPDWSHDGQRILFLTKTFGDAMEIDLATKSIRNLTAHYPHHGYTRALYLSNGDILLAGPEEFDPKAPGRARRNCYLYVLDRTLKTPATPLGVFCNEGPAVSRVRLRIAWTEWSEPGPADGNTAPSRMFEGEIMFTNEVPMLVNRQLVLDGTNFSTRATMETQNFRPPHERELIFSLYTKAGRYCDVLGIDLELKKITRYTDTPEIYDEVEGIFPNGEYTLVECDRHNGRGSGHIDIWKLKLDGSGELERLTHFSDYAGFKASNPVVSDDGRFIAFQLGKSRDAPGVGHGLFIYDLEKAK